MRITLSGLGATMAILPCLCFLAAGQDKGVQPTSSQVAKKVEAMRHTADTNARALAVAVQSRAIRTGAYDNVMTDYAKDLGGKIPINPCTGTRTGYTMTVSQKRTTATVAASAGNKCGKWAPKLYSLTL